MSAGLDTSTVTPGNAPPDSSFTTPEIEVPVCADAATGPMTHNRARTVGSNNNLRISSPFQNEERRTKLNEERRTGTEDGKPETGENRETQTARRRVSRRCNRLRTRGTRATTTKRDWRRSVLRSVVPFVVQPFSRSVLRAVADCSGSSSLVLRSKFPQVVHQVPQIRLAEPLSVSLHVDRRPIAHDGEDLAVA